MNGRHMAILGLSGSLRKQSYNTYALEALSQLAPEGVEVSIFYGIRDLPLFNPDLEGEPVPAVVSLKSALQSASGLIIASPEYAHGISGVMKNALDWLVSGEEFVCMPVMLVNTSPRAFHAQASLREVITTMSGDIIEEACLSIPLLGSKLDAEGILLDKALKSVLESHLQAFCAVIRARRA